MAAGAADSQPWDSWPQPQTADAEGASYLDVDEGSYFDEDDSTLEELEADSILEELLLDGAAVVLTAAEEITEDVTVLSLVEDEATGEMTAVVFVVTATGAALLLLVTVALDEVEATGDATTLVLDEDEATTTLEEAAEEAEEVTTMGVTDVLSVEIGADTTLLTELLAAEDESADGVTVTVRVDTMVELPLELALDADATLEEATGAEDLTVETVVEETVTVCALVLDTAATTVDDDGLTDDESADDDALIEDATLAELLEIGATTDEEGFTVTTTVAVEATAEVDLMGEADDTIAEEVADDVLMLEELTALLELATGATVLDVALLELAIGATVLDVALLELAIEEAVADVALLELATGATEADVTLLELTTDATDAEVALLELATGAADEADTEALLLVLATDTTLDALAGLLEVAELAAALTTLEDLTEEERLTELEDLVLEIGTTTVTVVALLLAELTMEEVADLTGLTTGVPTIEVETLLAEALGPADDAELTALDELVS